MAAVETDTSAGALPVPAGWTRRNPVLTGLQGWGYFSVELTMKAHSLSLSPNKTNFLRSWKP